MDIYPIEIGYVYGLGESEREQLRKLMDVYISHQAKNQIKDRYYEGKIRLNEVNLGIALPKSFCGLEIGCSWGAKCVDVLASRSMFDGYVSTNGDEVEDLKDIVDGNQLLFEYMKATRDELKYGCTFTTLSADPNIGCKIRFHSPQTASALWNGEEGRIECGFAIIDTAPSNDPTEPWKPSHINLYNDDAVWEIRRTDNMWRAERHPHRMGRPLMEPLVWNSTSNKPFGRSRIKEPIRRLIQGYVRTLANATIGLEFATAPQKYIMGVTDDQFEQIVDDKFKQYVGSVLAATMNPESGEKPTFGQLTQGNIQPHVDMLRLLATQFAAATGLTIMDTGVVNDANPTSSEAINAQSQTLIMMAEQLNKGNGESLKTIAQMAMAVKESKTLDELDDGQKEICAHFKNPAMPSISSTADAAIKIASAREAFASTDVFLEMVGFDQADIRRTNGQERRKRGLTTFTQIQERVNANSAGNMEQIRSSATNGQNGSGGTVQELSGNVSSNNTSP